MHVLRPFQNTAVQSVFREWKGVRSTLLVMPVGTGKTTVVAAIAKQVVADGGRFMFCAHTDELVRQGAEEFEAYTGIPVAIEKASETAHTARSPLTMASIQSIGQSRRMARFSPAHYDVVAADEAHRGAAPTSRRVFDYFQGAKCLGVTATPARSDKAALSCVFDSIAFEYTMREALDDGWLCPIVAQQIPVAIDLDKVKMRRGDWDDVEADEAIRPYLEKMADMVVEHGEGRSGIIFLPLVATSQVFAKLLKDRGIEAEAVWGTDPDRKEKIAALKSGSLQILTNANLLTEGFNCPRVSMIGPFIPTRSRSRYIQQIGRGTRIFPDKEYLLILDPMWLASKYAACVPASLFGEVQEVADAATEARRQRGGRGNVRDDADAAYSDFAQRREAQIARSLDENKWKKARSINPLDFAALVHDDYLLTYTPTRSWEEQPASDRQKAALSQAGMDVVGMTRGMANAVFDRLGKRREQNLATPKQVRSMARLGIKDADRYSFKEASKVLDIASGCGWMPKTTMRKLNKKGLLK